MQTFFEFVLAAWDLYVYCMHVCCMHVCMYACTVYIYIYILYRLVRNTHIHNYNTLYINVTFVCIFIGCWPWSIKGHTQIASNQCQITSADLFFFFHAPQILQNTIWIFIVYIYIKLYFYCLSDSVFIQIGLCIPLAASHYFRPRTIYYYNIFLPSYNFNLSMHSKRTCKEKYYLPIK